MASIASPRPSITLSSRRTSTSTEATERSTSTTRAPQASATGSLRRNRAALRDYYGLKPAAAASTSRDASPAPSPVTAAPPEQDSVLDKEGFDPQQYVTDLLAQEGLEGVLRTEASLVSEIRGLDGEKKALVYDNYSKLIAATDTIRKMRMNMDPLTPTTSTLIPAVGHIADTAAALKASLREHASAGNGVNTGQLQETQKQQTVRWVLGAPERLKAMKSGGRDEEARQEWDEVGCLLEKWKGVKGVEELRERCVAAMAGGKPSLD